MTNLIISLCNTFSCAQRRSLWRVEKRNATVFGTMARNQAMGGVTAVKITCGGIKARHET